MVEFGECSIGCSDGRECATGKPSPPADAVPTYRIGGERANKGGSNARKRDGAAHTKDVRPLICVTTEASNEWDVSGPLPKCTRIPNMRGHPAYLSMAEWERCLRGEYVPSRKRYKPSALDSDAAMVRRKGDSSPRFIPEGRSQEEAIRLSLEINHFEKLLASALSPAEQACVKYNGLNSNHPKRRRRRVIKHLDKLIERLQPLQRKLAGEPPASEPARKRNIPLICAITTQPNYTDKALTSDLGHGMPIVGGIPRTNALHAENKHCFHEFT